MHPLFLFFVSFGSVVIAIPPSPDRGTSDSGRICLVTAVTKETEDPSPMDWALWSQVSDTIPCNEEDGCIVGHENITSVTVNYFTSGEINEWIKSGFRVSKSWTSGNNYECEYAKGDTMCVFFETQHVEYTVNNWLQWSDISCGNPKLQNSVKIAAPVSGNPMGGFRCRKNGDCRKMGKKYWWPLHKIGFKSGP